VKLGAFSRRHSAIKAAGSASELEYHSTFAKDLKLLQYPEYEVIYEEVTQIKRMLFAFTKTPKADN